MANRKAQRMQRRKEVNKAKKLMEQRRLEEQTMREMNDKFMIQHTGMTVDETIQFIEKFKANYRSFDDQVAAYESARSISSVIVEESHLKPETREEASKWIPLTIPGDENDAKNGQKCQSTFVGKAPFRKNTYSKRIPINNGQIHKNHRLGRPNSKVDEAPAPIQMDPESKLVPLRFPLIPKIDSQKDFDAIEARERAKNQRLFNSYLIENKLNALREWKRQQRIKSEERAKNERMYQAYLALRHLYF